MADQEREEKVMARQKLQQAVTALDNPVSQEALDAADAEEGEADAEREGDKQAKG